ncbi:MAG TPA: cytochrome b N-terminal domain-containing protein [Candidatus Limnocylindrales bacterium]|nr:cytochrome b N-terminal domain-containing protein [Candidatus Limnocylindrales bacterium]
MDATTPAAPPQAAPRGWGASLRDQFGLDLLIRGLIRDYLIPADTNTLWYILGGVLGIAIGLEFLTGAVLLLSYYPDAAVAYQSTRDMLNRPFWSVILNFHYYTSYLIFALVMLHMMRVFISGAYRATKTGLWLVGVALASVVFGVSITGETLHWDERGFAVPWHVGEFLEALGLQHVFNWVHKDLLNVSFATSKLISIYVLHVVILPALLISVIVVHYYLIRMKGISLPFWHAAVGRKTPFSEHIRAWLIYGGVILGAILVLSIVVHRGPGPAPQNLPISPYYHAKGGPGSLGITPTYPISWTHGMNRFVFIFFKLEPDIWGTVIGMALMLGALVAIPFVDRGSSEPHSWAQAFSSHRVWAFALIALFWATMIAGVVTNAVSPVG